MFMWYKVRNARMITHKQDRKMYKSEDHPLLLKVFRLLNDYHTKKQTKPIAQRALESIVSVNEKIAYVANSSFMLSFPVLLPDGFYTLNSQKNLFFRIDKDTLENQERLSDVWSSLSWRVKATPQQRIDLRLLDFPRQSNSFVSVITIKTICEESGRELTQVVDLNLIEMIEKFLSLDKVQKHSPLEVFIQDSTAPKMLLIQKGSLRVLASGY